MRLAVRWMNALVALVTLASALAVLWSDLFVPGYRAHYRDAVWFVAAYAGVQAWMVVGFARGSALMPWFALARTAAAYLFLLNFFALWPTWPSWTPARYVYQLFSWGEGSRIGLFALVFVGRGAGNTLNAMYWTRAWWMRLRVTHPLLGRIVTALPIGLAALCVWAFLQLVGEEARTFSPEASEVARTVADGLDCDTVRARAGRTTADVRQRGDRRYDVEIAWGCPVTRVAVRAADGRLGKAIASRPDCCALSSPAAPPPR